MLYLGVGDLRPLIVDLKRIGEKHITHIEVEADEEEARALGGQVLALDGITLPSASDEPVVHADVADLKNG